MSGGGRVRSRRWGVGESLRMACRRDVVARATRTALAVGAILIAINQGDVLLAGTLTAGTVFKLILTPAVPYLVSTYSSVAALRGVR